MTPWNIPVAVDLQRFHDAARMIELDGVEGYHSCCKRFGTDIANALVVAHCRMMAIAEKEKATGFCGWPDEDTTKRANELLRNVVGNPFKV